MNRSLCSQIDVQAATAASPVLHGKRGWKEQLHRDVTVIRVAVQQRGGITENTIADAVRRYREQVETGRA